ncbi:hypothetical protein YPPY48_3044, partial [Yersinia pestis PY-48]
MGSVSVQDNMFSLLPNR